METKIKILHNFFSDNNEGKSEEGGTSRIPSKRFCSNPTSYKVYDSSDEYDQDKMLLASESESEVNSRNLSSESDSESMSDEEVKEKNTNPKVKRKLTIAEKKFNQNLLKKQNIATIEDENDVQDQDEMIPDLDAVDSNTEDFEKELWAHPIVGLLMDKNIGWDYNNEVVIRILQIFKSFDCTELVGAGLYEKFARKSEHFQNEVTMEALHEFEEDLKKVDWTDSEDDNQVK